MRSEKNQVQSSTQVFLECPPHCPPPPLPRRLRNNTKASLSLFGDLSPTSRYFLHTYLTSKGRYCLEIFVIENNHHNQVFVGNNTAIVFTRDVALLFGRTGNLSCVTLILTKRLFVCRVMKLNNVKLEISQE